MFSNLSKGYRKVKEGDTGYPFSKFEIPADKSKCEPHFENYVLLFRSLLPAG